MTWAIGVSDNFMGFPLTPLIIQVLDGKKLGPSDVLFGHAVLGEQGVQEGTKYTPLRGPRVEDKRGRRVVAYPYRPVRKSRIQLQREVFSPWVLSLVLWALWY